MAAYIYGLMSVCFECSGSEEAEGWRPTLAEAVAMAEALAEPGRPSWVDVLHDDGTIATVWTSDRSIAAESRVVDISPATAVGSVSYRFDLDAH